MENYRLLPKVQPIILLAQNKCKIATVYSVEVGLLNAGELGMPPQALLLLISWLTLHSRQFSEGSSAFARRLHPPPASDDFFLGGLFEARL